MGVVAVGVLLLMLVFGMLLIVRGRRTAKESAPDAVAHAGRARETSSEIGRLRRYAAAPHLQRKRCESETWCESPATCGIFVGTSPAPFQCYCDDHIAAALQGVTLAYPNWSVRVQSLWPLGGVEAVQALDA